MKVKEYKNQWGHQSVDCPFCGQRQYVQDATKSSPDRLRGLKRHITNKAKSEALGKALEPMGEYKHLDYYIEHTKPKVVRVIEDKREYDNDLSL